MPPPPEFSALLLDIEGTITSISFVKDQLFPYAYDHVERYLQEHFEDGGLQGIISDLRGLAKEQLLLDPDQVRIVRDNKAEAIEDLVHNVRHWINTDKKLTAMKALQGLIWEEAYRRGDVKGHLYPDVLPVLELLCKRSPPTPIYIYSSGSVHAQKLLFTHSINGDITGKLSGYFDTNVGLKGEAESYKSICRQIGRDASEVLFLTDVEAEARAANEAGLQVRLVVRQGNAPLSEEAKKDFIVIHTLDDII
ncbi:hypothetical protein WR25_01553 [Diploscapter pachys]|uniref:Enolase-phosphatase E1 n=1 Tax=Diploscapter pachys TaxID=2018661 RepID=A0A2A2K5N3_9BILA|nr:hypothetical protein WR25_01553 [Diploscapter pachys]